MPQESLKVGSRCRFNELGKSKSPKVADKEGVVVSLIGATRAAVLLDGNRNATTYHLSYLEPIT